MNFPVFDGWQVAILWRVTCMVAHGTISTFRFTKLLWNVFDLRMHRDDGREKQGTQRLQCLAGHQPG
jgi:hypothetical protein